MDIRERHLQPEKGGQGSRRDDDSPARERGRLEGDLSTQAKPEPWHNRSESRQGRDRDRGAGVGREMGKDAHARRDGDAERRRDVSRGSDRHAQGRQDGHRQGEAHGWREDTFVQREGHEETGARRERPVKAADGDSRSRRDKADGGRERHRDRDRDRDRDKRQREATKDSEERSRPPEDRRHGTAASRSAQRSDRRSGGMPLRDMLHERDRQQSERDPSAAGTYSRAEADREDRIARAGSHDQEHISTQEGLAQDEGAVCVRKVGPTGSATAPSETPFYDPALDFLSASFDALRALLTPRLQPPNPKVLPLDNVSKCRAILPSDNPESLAARAAAAAAQPPSEAAAAKRARDQVRREAVRARREAEKAAAPALQRVMGAVPEGPLGLLRRCYLARGTVMVRVVTRHQRGVRGVATGHLQGYDKHMNLILRNVDEQYTVRLRVERARFGWVRASPGELAGGGGRAKKGKVERSKLAWKQEHRRRRLAQVLLRGDSIVLISALPSSQHALEQA